MIYLIQPSALNNFFTCTDKMPAYISICPVTIKICPDIFINPLTTVAVHFHGFQLLATNVRLQGVRPGKLSAVQTFPSAHISSICIRATNDLRESTWLLQMASNFSHTEMQKCLAHDRSPDSFLPRTARVFATLVLRSGDSLVT